MKLTLRLENVDFLPDGGPLEHSVSGRGFEVGRDTAMDWTLPDPNRHISSRHFEIQWRQGAYWLLDTSTNGTFLYGQQMRLPGPYELSHNDRLQVGHYIIRVLIEADRAEAAGWPAAPAPVAAPPPGAAHFPAYDPAPAPPPAADPWNLGGAGTPAPLPPADRRGLPLAGLYGDGFVDTGRPAPAVPPAAAPMPAPVPAPPTGQPPGQPGPGAAPLSASIPPMPQPFPAPPGPAGFGAPAAPPSPRLPPAPSMPAPPVAVPPAAEPFVPRPSRPSDPAPAAPVTAASAAAPRAAAGHDALLDGICRGAGLPAGALARRDPAELGEEIGRSLRITVEALMALLGARAAAKQFVKSGSRTMIGGLNNSPLKFKPTATEALETMFVQRSDAYLSATAALDQGFDDIRRHQTAVYAAMQPALARLLEDLAPEAIEQRISGGIVTSKKSRAWDTFVERWDAKTHPHENGMLDLFLLYFAEAYDAAVKTSGEP